MRFSSFLGQSLADALIQILAWVPKERHIC